MVISLFGKFIQKVDSKKFTEMSIQYIIDKMKRIQTKLLEFIENESGSDEQAINPKDIFDEINICENKHDLKLFLHLILNISNNHNRKNDFITKIEQILKFLKNDIIKNFSNDEIFNIFKSNKRVLLFLFDEKIITMNKKIIKTMIKGKCLESKYPQYFSPEIKQFSKEKWFLKISNNDENDYRDGYYQFQINKNNWVEEILKELPEDLYEKRKIGENDGLICELIQKDSIIEFIKYINKNSISLTCNIRPSIYETNYFILKRQKNDCDDDDEKKNELKISLIEYAAFCGSNEIFKYLQLNNVDLTSSLWIYAIHGKNAEIIHTLEENNIEPENKKYAKCLKESIKCHHNDIADYIQNNYFSNENVNDTLIYGINYYNFAYMQSDFKNEKLFYYLCKNDYYLFVKILLTEISDINMIIIYIAII